MTRNPKVLVVDDQEEIRDLLRQSLEPDGYQVIVAEGGKKALSICRQENPDIVLLDIKMPDLNGIETLRQLREIDPHGELQIIMLTGYGDIDTARQAMELGAYDYLTKPFILNFIKSLLEEITAAKECES